MLRTYILLNIVHFVGVIKKLFDNTRIHEIEYGRTPIVRINWDVKPSGYAENPDNWIFLKKWATLAD